jgi:AraC-like DNA-binding protein
MSDLTLYIKNMVCDRCKAAVKHDLEKLNIDYKAISLGMVDLNTKPAEKQLADLRSTLTQQGFELIEDKTARLISRIKAAVIEFVRKHDRQSARIKFSDFLTEKLHKDYSSLSKLFSDVEGVTIEKYLILQKTERVKELLVYDELNLSEIAYELNYSSIQHLSNQFKKVTGLTPSHFKKIGLQKRKSLDKV